MKNFVNFLGARREFFEFRAKIHAKSLNFLKNSAFGIEKFKR